MQALHSQETSLTSGTGFLLVALSAALWGSDALFRRRLALELPAPTVVFAEHLILVVLTVPLLVRALRVARRRFTFVEWMAALLVGAGASATATILFTAAFRYGDPTTPLLLQKVQPLVAVLGARLLLGERLMPRYLTYFLLGVSGAYLVTFPDPLQVGVAALAPAALAGAAASLWAMGTVLGRHLTSKIEFAPLTALRFAIGLPAATLILWLMHGNPGFAVPTSDFPALLLLALIPGLLALLLYYRGLSRTPAAAATLAELAFPLSAVSFGYFVFGHALSPTQWIGLVLLSGTITVMSIAGQRGSDAMGVRLGQSFVMREAQAPDT